MGIAEMRSAFNEAAQGEFTCNSARLSYEPGDTIQWQRLTFSGTAKDGSPFEARSDRLRPESDVNAASREVAKKLMASAKPAAVQEEKAP